MKRLLEEERANLHGDAQAQRQKMQSEIDELKKLVDYILKHHFGHVKPARHLEKEDWVLAMFANIVDSTGESSCLNKLLIIIR